MLRYRREKYAKYAIGTFTCFLVMLLLAACQSAAPGATIAQEPGKTATRTPFQAVLPTPAPTVTQAPPTPTALPSPTEDVCAGEPGRIEAMQQVFSGPPLSFRVYFPPCFDRQPAARYPVLYMIHGQTFKDDQWERLGIGAAADQLIWEKASPPFLIVMPQEDDTFEDIYAASFGPDVTDGLIPWVDATYPTCADRACRAIGGLSRGGAWALHLGFAHWALFSAIGLHSTPPFNGDPQQFSRWLYQIPAGQVPRVFMDIGRNDPFLSNASQFEDILVATNVAHEWYLFNGNHNEEYWSSHVADYLRWYAAPWKDLPQELLPDSR